MSEFTFPKNPDECLTLGVDDSKEYLRREAEAKGDPIKGLEVAQWVIETAYGEDVYAQLKASTRDVNTLNAMITMATFGLRDEIKNFTRSGHGEPTRTD
jgi:hypothetical protein